MEATMSETAQPTAGSNEASNQATAAPQAGEEYVSSADSSGARVMAAAMVERGLWTQEQADSALLAEGAENPAAPKQDPTDAFPAAQAHEYQLPNTNAPQGTPLQEIQAHQTEVRNWMAYARLPSVIGNSIAKEAESIGTKYQAMSETERGLWTQEQAHILSNKGFTPARIGLAEQLIAEVAQKYPGIKENLINSGAGNSAAVIAQLVLHAERLYAKAK